jgi:uncharacterized membrane protein YeaQ/YmgE (transglycosylase-associated protein family)
MNIIAWIILGLLAGAIAKWIFPGRQGGGFLATMVLGIILNEHSFNMSIKF